MSTNKSFCTYRAALDSCVLPATPFLGLYLTDITFVHQGNPDTVPSPVISSLQLVNYLKVRVFAGTGAIAHVYLIQ